MDKKNSIVFIQPAGVLQLYIDNYYLINLESSVKSVELEQKPISNGCMEMFIGYHDTIGTCYTNHGGTFLAKSALIGVHDLKHHVKGMALESNPKTFKFAAVNFKPNGFYGIFKIPSVELYNGFFESSEVLGNDIHKLQDQLDTTKNHHELKLCLDRYFINQLNKTTYKLDLSGFGLMNFIKQQHGKIKIKELAFEFKQSERTLERNLKNLLGLSPKEYCKIVRFRSLLEHINKHQDINWFDMVMKYGYYDQAHLINEFKSATGLTPEIYIKYKGKSVFKINNHIVVMNPDAIYSEVHAAMAKGEAIYQQFDQEND
jgi:AraC-like DNA-binding protein